MLNIGVDLGGTNIAVGVVDEQGRILTSGSTPTGVGRPYAEIIKDMARCVEETVLGGGFTMQQIEHIGIGIPGLADLKTGRVIFCVNLHWTDVPLGEEMERLLGKPVYIENDATVAGLAEYVAGISRGTESSVFLTLGTGVGSGIILNGKPWSGHHGAGGEIGHIMLKMGGVQCNCGNRGCVDRYCSASAIIRMGRESLENNPDSALIKLCGGDPESLSAKHVMDAAKLGDPAAMAIFETYVADLAQTINSVVSFLDPEMVVLGGGVSKTGDFLVEAVRERVPKLLLYKSVPSARIEIAQLGSDAGIIGAAMLKG